MWTMGITQWNLPGNRAYTMQLAKQLGFDAVQLEYDSMETGMAMSHKRVRELFVKESRELGIKLLPLTINALGRHCVVNGFHTPDGQIAKEVIPAALEAAAEMGIDGVTIPSFGYNEIHTREHYEHTVEALRYACEKAAPLGLMVYTENVLDAQEMDQLFRDCGSDRLLLLFDSQNYAVAGRDCAVDVLKTHWDRLGNHLHVKDGGDTGTMLLGTGTSPYAQVMEVLRERRYEGTIVLENNYGLLPLCAQAKDGFSLVEKDMAELRRAMK